MVIFRARKKRFKVGLSFSVTENVFILQIVLLFSFFVLWFKICLKCTCTSSFTLSGIIPPKAQFAPYLFGSFGFNIF